MTVMNKEPALKQAVEAFMPKVDRRLHAWVKVLKDGKPALVCIWNEDGKRTYKELVFMGDEAFDARAVAKSMNRAMNASDVVVQMLVDLYASQKREPVGEQIEF